MRKRPPIDDRPLPCALRRAALAAILILGSVGHAEPGAGNQGRDQDEERARNSATNPAGKPTVVPAALRSVSPPGVMRGRTVTLTLQGVNLSGASRCMVDDPTITARVLPSPIPLLKRGEVKVEAVLAPGARVGIHRLSLETPLGTTGTATFAVGGWPEVEESADPDSSGPTTLSLPATAIGKLSAPGEVDAYRFQARAGEELVFEVVASAIRSRLNSVLTLRDDRGEVVAQNNDGPTSVDSLLGHRFIREGVYTIEIRDYENASGDDVHYRLNVGAFPYVTGIFPLGVRRGSRTEIALRGFNLGAARRVVAQGAAPRANAAAWGETMPLPVETASGPPLNEVRVALGNEPEITEAERSDRAGAGQNDSPAAAQRVKAPVTINGTLESRAPADGSPADCYRFRARKGERLIVEIAARRLGSPLDSFLEVLDARGRRIERATLRCVAETTLALNDRDADSSGFRLQSWVDLALNDLVFAGRELLRVARLPNGPDDDVAFYTLRGRRVGLMDTTPEYHSLGSSVFKVTVHPPGARFAPNGMPVFRLYTQNDDGTPLYGKDSRVSFDPPADGEYVVRLTDAQGRGSKDHAYRLTLRPPRPDFRLAMSPEHPNVPRGGSAPVEVSVERIDDYAGPIQVRIDGLPTGVSALPVVIAPGASSATLTLTAASDAVGGPLRAGLSPHPPAPSPNTGGGGVAATLPTDSPLQVLGEGRHGREAVVLVRAAEAEPSTHGIRVTGRAVIAGREILRAIEPQGGSHRLVVLPSPDVTVRTDRQAVTIRPGGQVDVTAIIERRHGFAGRVPIDVRNLPFGVRVLDVGLNGVLVTEQETRRRFVLIAEPWVEPQSRPFYAVARVESDPSSDLASPPITLTVAAGNDKVTR